MRTALVVLIMLVRFGPDLVYAASDTLPHPDPSRQTPLAPDDGAEVDRQSACGGGDPAAPP
jgi:hypothetical protein